MAGGMHGRGGVCDRGVCMAGGHVWQGGVHGRGVHGRGHAWQERQPLQRVVCILLECILVYILFQINVYVSFTDRF